MSHLREKKIEATRGQAAAKGRPSPSAPELLAGPKLTLQGLCQLKQQAVECVKAFPGSEPIQWAGLADLPSRPRKLSWPCEFITRCMLSHSQT